MLFNSIAFFVFFALVLALYWAAPRRLQNPILLIASYVFYGFWDWRFLGLIALSTLIDFSCARAIEDGPAAARRRWLLVSVGTNLGLLAFFKYFNFFVDSFAELCAALGWSVSTTTLDIVLPVGISFYTFQTMSYTIDVYRGELAATRSLPSFALYVAYFPQLVAGPIERATRLLPQIEKARTIGADDLREGAWLVLLGLFKKVVIADNMARIVEPVFAGEGASAGVTTLLAVYAFALQIYADFSGYTDIARGVSRCLGIDLMVNFRRPYFAADPQEFWRRWHISLSQWLRDYLYIPLGGNRGGALRSYRNLILTMLLGGLWHGASWMFVIWGAIHGALLVVHRLWRRLLGGLRGAWALDRLAAPVLGLAFFHAVCFAWIFFRARSMASVGEVLGGLASTWTVADADVATLRYMAICALPLVILDLWEEWYERRHGLRPRGPAYVFAAPAPLRGLVFAVLILYIAIAGAPAGAEFIYFQF
ncbi:MAG: MBOAT family protein [Myxococcales bacterium]|nr:MBOAT family protein [Myxococcales bacterium]